uniref:Venom protein 2 n=1 Tax=Microctonus hyperodae TaxID=165561 RepID=A9YME0_MICHY|nr:venom protein 2 [Microctonus hyperodae]
MSRILYMILLILVILARHQVNPFVATIGDIATVSNFANDALAFVNGELPLGNLIMGSTGHAINIITEKMDKLSDTLNEMESNNERRMNYMPGTLISRIPQEIKVILDCPNYVILIGVCMINYLRIMSIIQRIQESYDRSTIDKFIDAVTSHRIGDLPETLGNMHLLMMPGRSEKYQKPLLEILTKGVKCCHLENYAVLVLHHSSVCSKFIMLFFLLKLEHTLWNIFSYAMLTSYKNTSFAGEMRKAAAQLVTRAQGYLISTKRAMKEASLTLDYCDPKNFTRGENFVELEKSIQMFVGNEVDINGNSCSDVCSNIDSSGIRSDARNCDKNNGNSWCPLQSCYGRIYDCISASTASVCELGKSSLRRYDWVEDHYNNHNYGNTNSCNGRIRNPSYYRSGLTSCDVCICTCADEIGESPANRTINLRPQLSNIEANMVITGVKFISSDKIIHIQIKEGELMSGGRIKPETEHWIEPENFEYDPKGILKSRKVGSFFLSTGNKMTLMKHGMDFTFVTFFQREINLDDVKAPSGYVVTGVKFVREGNDTDGLSRRRLQLAIYVTKFDFLNGVLMKDSSYWISQENMPNRPENYGLRRNEVELSAPDDPTKGKDHKQISKPGQYVKFTTSDRVNDAGQATIPFFDGQSVTSTISTALSGLGLFHRGASGSGGFFGIKIVNSRFT